MTERREHSAMTVDEAKNKMCCIKDRFDTNIYYCQASGCMAWRCFDTEVKNEGYCGLAGKEN